MSPSTDAQIRAALETVLKRSATDADFRSAALANPHGVLEAYTGTAIPFGVAFCFVENSSAKKYFTLPDHISEAELSDDELEQVAGGCITFSCANTGKSSEDS